MNVQRIALYTIGSVLLMACADSEPMATTEMPLVTDGSEIIPWQTNLGYSVSITDARMVIDGIDFMVGGERHLSWIESVGEWLVPTAYAHPEHMQGGEVAGRLDGRLIVDWTHGDRAQLGLVELQTRSYASASFRFARATLEDGLDAHDPLLGHTALLAGVATKDQQRASFTVLIDSPFDRQLIGAPFQVEVADGDERQLGLQLLMIDPFERDTLFDDVDFLALAEQSDAPLEMREDTAAASALEAYYAVRRTFQTHDQFRIAALP